MKVGCLTDDLAKQLIKVFGDAPDQGTCPNNVWINHKDLAHTSLVNQDMEGMDFLFAPSSDGVHHQLFKEPIDLDECFEYGTNVWIVADKLSYATASGSTAIKSPLLYKEAAINEKLYLSSSFPDIENAQKHILFTGTAAPVAVYEHKNKGFVIISSAEFIEQIDRHVPVFYEILFYIYRQAYRRTGYITDWIADITPDYVIVDNKITKKDAFLSKKKVSEFFNLLPTEVSFAEVLIDKENVIMKTFRNDYVQFEKKFTDIYASYADPVKPTEMISIYTPRQNIIYFDDFVYTIEDDVLSALDYKRIENSYEFSMRAFKNSFHGINLKNTYLNKVKVELTKVIDYQETAINMANFYLCTSDGLLYIVEVEEYLPDRKSVV